MAFFDNFKVMTNSVTKSATDLMNSVSTEVKEQDNKARINREMGAIDTEIDAAYTQIGRKYVEYYIQNQESTGLDVSDLLKMLEPKLARKAELNAELIEIEKRVKDMALLKEKNKLEAEFTAEKEKLDRALAMDVITQGEYDQKVTQHSKRIELFDEIKNIEQQFDFGIITAEEKEIKINSLLND